MPKVASDQLLAMQLEQWNAGLECQICPQTDRQDAGAAACSLQTCTLQHAPFHLTTP